MNETAKTGIFVAVAAALALTAWFNRSNLPEAASPGEMRDQLLFPEFKNAVQAASLEIVEYDEATATPRPLKVAQVKGRWSIPSHDDYPTDAKDQLAEAAGSLLRLKVLDVASDARGDHSLYGVLDPDPKTLPAGATGVGTRVSIRDKGDKPLLSMVIGKAVAGRDGLRYVRRSGQDPVYVVALKTDKLTARFGDWIEKDLLKFNAFDMKQLEIQDYSIDMARGVQNVRGVLHLTFDDTASDAKWKLVEDKSLKGKELVSNPLGADEELNTTTLDDLKNALADLKIVDVNRKPAGLSADLKTTGKMKPSQEMAQSLSDRGFYLVPVEGTYEVLSDQGEVHVGMKDGVEYILRFGQIAGQGEAKAKGKGKDAKKEESAGVNRYLFVMAEFNRDAIAKPAKEKVPDEPKEEPKAAKADASKKPAEKKAAAEKNPGDKKDSAAKKDPKAEWKAEKERIEKENKRKLDDYDRQLKEGKEHVEKLNARFADWYYVIADNVYQKVHLGRQKIVKKKEKKKKDEGKEHAHDHDHHDDDHDHQHAAEPSQETFTPADFEDLKRSGVKSP